MKTKIFGLLAQRLCARRASTATRALPGAPPPTSLPVRGRQMREIPKRDDCRTATAPVELGAGLARLGLARLDRVQQRRRRVARTRAAAQRVQRGLREHELPPLVVAAEYAEDEPALRVVP